MLCLCLWLHHGNRLDLALKDEEAVVVEINAFVPQQVANFLERSLAIIQEVR